MYLIVYYAGIASSSNQGSVGKQDGVYIQGGAGVSADTSGMTLLASRAKQLLNEDEVKAIIRHIRRVSVGIQVEERKQ